MVALRTSRKRRHASLVTVTAMLGALALSAPVASGAAGASRVTADPSSSLTRTLLAKAPIDGCYTPGSTEVSYPVKGKCAAGQTKVSGAYLWGQTKLDKNIWFGTAANYLCNVLAQEYMALGMDPQPVKTDQLVCEYGDGAYYKEHLQNDPQFSAYEGDWRPPRIYRYDTVTRTVKDMTPADNSLVNLTEGFRAAGSVGNTVFLAGPVVGQQNEGPANGVMIFAFDNTTGALIDSVNVTDFTNIRSFLTVGNSLYAGLMTSTGGVIAHWVGTPEDPFSGGPNDNGFEPVGQIPEGQGGPAELAYHQGHLVATTWNMAFASGHPSTGSAVFMSATTHPENEPFTEADNQAWKPIWSPAAYEPDMLIRGTYMGGAIASYGDYVYFGTLHGVESGAMLNIMARQQGGQTLSAQELATALIDGNRATSIWRVSNLDAAEPTVELLYGESTLPAYDYLGTAGWTNQPTNWTPTYGASGFGNPFNAYSWSMKAFKDQLYVGTFDWSYLLSQGAPVLAGMLGLPAETVATLATLLTATSGTQYGADLARFPSVNEEAVLEDQTGLGDYLNYGVRTMTADDKALYIGTANPANLATSKSRALGGWQLLQLAPKIKK